MTKLLELETDVDHLDLAVIRTKLLNICTTLDAALVDRTEEIQICILAILCGQHVLFVGEPGVAKSLTLNSILAGFDGTVRKYETCLNPYTGEDQLFGPLDLPKLAGENGSPCEYTRLTAGFLADAHFAFLDEIFRCNKASLQTLLPVMNERKFLQGGRWISVPLRTLVTAANRFPEDDDELIALGAMYDRLLFRRIVKDVDSYSGLERVVCGDCEVKFSEPAKLTLAELDAAQAAVRQVEVTPEWFRMCFELGQDLKAKGCRFNARRFKQAVLACKAAAWLDSKDPKPLLQKVHLEPLQHILWSDPTEQPDVCQKLVMAVANPFGLGVTRLTGEIESIYSEIMRPNITGQRALECVRNFADAGDELKRLAATGRTAPNKDRKRFNTSLRRFAELEPKIRTRQVRVDSGMK